MYSMRLSCGNEANPRIRNAAKVTALFAVALLALPAFAGTATYVGSHTEDDVRISDFAALAGNQIATYTGEAIVFTADGSEGFGMQIFHNEEGDPISFSDGSNPNEFKFTMVIEGVTLPDFNVDPIAWSVMVNATAGSQQIAFVINDAGTDTIVGSYANIPPTITPPDIALPITYPVTLTIERSDGMVTTSAVDATNTVFDLGTNAATDASAYDPRIIFGALDGTPSTFMASMTVSLIEFSGDLVPDVNQPPPGGGGGAEEGVVVVDVDSATMYIEPLEDLPDSGNPTGWTARVYDLSQDDGKGDPDNDSANWAVGQHGVGFGDDDDTTTITDDDDTFGIYTRTDFTVDDASRIEGMQVAVDYDDAYIMYINGTEVNRSETAEVVVEARWDSLGDFVGDSSEDGTLGPPISLDAFTSTLVDGVNVLAIHVMNNAPVSSDITMIARLTVDIGDPAVPTASITTTTDPEEPFTSNEAVWSVDFGEDVVNVGDADFVVEKTGDVEADAPTVDLPGTLGVYTVRSANVSGTEGFLRLALAGDHDIRAADDDALAVEGQSQAYFIGIPMPAVGILGLGLAAGAIAALGAAAARRRRN